MSRISNEPNLFFIEPFKPVRGPKVRVAHPLLRRIPSSRPSRTLNALTYLSFVLLSRLDLHLLPFDSLRPAFQTRELEEIYDLMSERNIRVRAPLEDFLEGWKEDSDSEEEDGDGQEGDPAAIGEEEQELIRKFEERKRLMPY